MAILPKQFYIQGLEHKSSGICVVVGGENGNFIIFNILILLIIIPKVLYI